jgi:hypothetical protein
VTRPVTGANDTPDDRLQPTKTAKADAATTATKARHVQPPARACPIKKLNDASPLTVTDFPFHLPTPDLARRSIHGEDSSTHGQTAFCHCDAVSRAMKSSLRS